MMALEDFTRGLVIPLAEYEVTEEEIIEFARRYDPQYFHIDPVAAADSPFGGLIASGWMTTAIFMRMQCDSFILDSTCVGSPGMDEIRWLAPVRPGDRLSGNNRVVDVKPSQSRPDRGTVYSNIEIYNQHGTLVMSLSSRVIYLSRQAVAG
jgi:acyl dehydratase